MTSYYTLLWLEIAPFFPSPHGPGPLAWHCWALLEVVQRLVSTPAEVTSSAGLEAKHHHSPRPGSPPARRGQPASSAREPSDWPTGLNGVALHRGAHPEVPGEAIGLSSSSRGYVCPEHSGGDRGADCEVRVGPTELSLGCFLIVVVKLRGLAFACRAP